MFRHAVLFLLFPDYFEPVATASHKRQIVKAFDPADGSLNDVDNIALDRAVLKVRKHLETQGQGSEINFYRSPLLERWRVRPTLPLDDAPSVSPAEAKIWFRERFGDVKVWWLSAAPGGRLWPTFMDGGIAVLSESDLGDLSEYRSQDAITQELVDLRRGSKPTNRSLALWQFSEEIRVNDVIIAHSGGSTILGWGTVKGDYMFVRPAVQSAYEGGRMAPVQIAA